MERIKEQELISRWLQGDPYAIELVNTINGISQVWDDLYDRDQPVETWQINQMMMQALITIPRNPFYQKHFSELQPIIEHALMTWLDSNQLEQSEDPRDWYVSYVLRSVTTDIFIHCCYLVGGAQWRLLAADEIRKTIYRDNESFGDYQTEIMEANHVWRRRTRSTTAQSVRTGNDGAGRTTPERISGHLHSAGEPVDATGANV